MTSGGLRERKKSQRRLLLHEAALCLVEQQGLLGTTIEQTCEAVEVSPRTFFNYFPTKAAAALGLPEHVVSPEAAAAFGASYGELIPALCDLVATSMITGVHVTRLKKLVTDHPDLLPTLNEWIAAAKDEFTHLVSQRVESPEYASAALALTLAAVRLLMLEPLPPGQPAGVRLLAMVDRMIASRHAEMMPPTS